MRAGKTLILNAKILFGDRTLQMLLLGVVLAAIFFVIAFEDKRFAVGVLLIGATTALIESKHYRQYKENAKKPGT
jgi:hypothetical protein